MTKFGTIALKKSFEVRKLPYLGWRLNLVYTVNLCIFHN